MSRKTQYALVKFLRKYPEKWHAFAQDRETVTDVCATANLGILAIKDNQMILKSVEKADMFLSTQYLNREVKK